ncbi:MAG: hypothetical protein EOO04_05840 [Chitinophagaceae bacterium]|nr:MAG: hypothetical protein EOO04_05840 [Chitinophagaceae bacterium]
MQNDFLLYGANGYTGRLIARYAKQYNLRPLLAGRSAAALQSLASETGFEYRVIDLNDKDGLQHTLKPFAVVVHAAGPFDVTAVAMVEACLATNTHYLDINGDTNVFETIKQYNQSAISNNTMLLPGAGFDVVPTDCTAALLKQHLPDATSLELAFVTTGGGLSHGTAKTMINNLGSGGARRKDGKIIRVPLGEHGFNIKIEGNDYFVMSIPWGDVSTAHFTTGIPDIETFTGVPINAYRLLKMQGAFNWLLRKEFVKNRLRAALAKRPAGPDDATRSKARALIWGRVTNNKGESRTVASAGPEGYTLTAHSTLLMVKKVLSGNLKAGYQTPATAYGHAFVLEVPGFRRGEVY